VIFLFNIIEANMADQAGDPLKKIQTCDSHVT